MKVQIKLKTLVTALIVGAAAAAAHAGNNANISVYVGATYASGAIHDARFSSDSAQYIGCSYESYSSGSAGYLYCAARNASGVTRSCYQYSPNAYLRAAVQSISESSYVRFYLESGSTRCGTIVVSNFSQYL